MYFNFDNTKIENSLVGLRVDLNSPVINGKILINERFYRHAKTIKELVKNKNRIVLFAHQGRKGKKDFLPSLKQHADYLTKILGFKVYYYDGLIEEDALNFVENLDKEEVVLMKNLRFYDFETNKEFIYNNPFVREYSKILDFYILDAFSVAHREQSSIVGFKDKLINVMGPIFEEEYLNALRLKHSYERPIVYVLGGEKVKDLIDLIVFATENNKVDKILTGGFLSVLALEAAGIETNDERVKEEENKKIINILSDYVEKLEIPNDVAINFNGKRMEISVFHLKNFENVHILDLGKNTIKEYSKIIKKAKTIYAKGPMGFFENKKFELGTKEILKSIIDNEKAFKFLGGGHIVTAFRKFFPKIKLNNSYISISGGAVVKLLSGKKLPGVEALKENYLLFQKKLLL